MLNKCDLVTPAADALPGALQLSAADGAGVEALLLHIEEALSKGTQMVKLLIPFSSYALLDRLHRNGGIHAQEHTAEGVLLTLREDERIVKSACKEGAQLVGDEIL